ncbi:MAG: Smr/MutS family protein [Nitrospirota bacterium]
MKNEKWSNTPLSGLAEALRRKGMEPRVSPRPKRERTDEELFEEAMAGVREIPEFRKTPLREPPASRPSRRKRDDTMEGLRAMRRLVQGKERVTLSDTAEYAEWASPEASGDIPARLHAGDFAVQDFIDLHGMTAREAEEALSDFLRGALRRRLACVKVIHGRGLRSPGGAVLREAVRKWLRGGLSKHVRAYATARGCDGGLGATYVLLKSR